MLYGGLIISARKSGELRNIRVPGGSIYPFWVWLSISWSQNWTYPIPTLNRLPSFFVAYTKMKPLLIIIFGWKAGPGQFNRTLLIYVSTAGLMSG